MAIRVTQLGVSVWAQNPSKIRVTQAGVSVWLNNPSKIRVTQIGNEIWVHNPSNIRVTQIGNEVWQSTALAPTTSVGNADGVSSVSGVPSNPAVGHADGVSFVVGHGPGTKLMQGIAEGVGAANAHARAVSISTGGAALLMVI
jgi:hypothetical protein